MAHSDIKISNMNLETFIEKPGTKGVEVDIDPPSTQTPVIINTEGSFSALKTDLQAALKECYTALEYFLNNRFSDALNLLRPLKDDSVYHAMGYSSILVMQAGMTFDPRDMDAAIVALKEALRTCQKFRRSSSIVETITYMWYKQPLDNLTEEEMHAELCYAEVLMQKALLTFLDESFVSFIRGGISIRNSFQIFKDCQAMSNTNTNGHLSTHIHFRGGVNMGIGSFNLMLSLLPAKVLRLMEFLGFSGDRELGLSQLREGAANDSLRSILSTLTLMMFHLYITVILGSGEGNLEEAEALLEPYIDKFPNGALILFYVARIALLKGDFTFAQEKYLACISAQQEWRQIHHLCYWELMWAYCYQQDWLQAYRYADLLCKESKWSQAIYVFQKASILSMLPAEVVEGTGENVEELYRQVEGLRLRFAGKSIPTEKFASRRAQRYSDQPPVKLVIPALEQMYVWNGITVVGKRPELTENILLTIETAEQKLQDDTAPSVYHVDDLCMLLLLKGLCLKNLGRLDQAEACFTQVISSEERIKFSTHLVPFTLYELGLLHQLRGDRDQALKCIENARQNYKNYSMESRLHFRIHAAITNLKQ